MASIYNSTSEDPKYILSPDNNYSFDRRKWEDVQLYTSVIITLKTEGNGVLKLRWANSRETEDGIQTLPTEVDFDNPLTVDSFEYSGDNELVTKQFDVKAKWLSVWFDGSEAEVKVDSYLTLSTVYKKAPTEIKFVNDSQEIVSVNVGSSGNNSLFTTITDMSGLILNSTGDQTSGNSLYTHLADSSGVSLDTTYQYRNIERQDVSHYVFDNSINNDDKLTILTSTNEFMVPTNQLGFKHGDQVKFIVLKDDLDPSQNIATVFDQDVSGHLRVNANVHFTQSDPSYTKFHLLVDKDIGEWFDGNLQELYPNTQYYLDMSIGDPDIFQTVDGKIQLKTTTDGTASVIIDQYYEAIQDISGFNTNSIVLNPGNIPLDLRLYQGVFNTTEREAVIMLDISNNPNLTLATALRDGSNNNLSSTHINSSTEWFFTHDPCKTVTYPRTLFVLYDGLYDGFETPEESKLFISYMINTFIHDQSYFNNSVSNLTNYGVSFNEDPTGPCHAFLPYQDICDNTLFTDNKGNGDDLCLRPDQQPGDYYDNGENYFLTYDVAGTGRDENLQQFDLWKTAHDLLNVISTNNFTDVVFITPNTRNFVATSNDLKDQLQVNEIWKNVNRYIIAPGLPSDVVGLTQNDLSGVDQTMIDNIKSFSGESEDILHFVNHPDHILYFLPMVNTDVTVASLISEYQTNGLELYQATNRATLDKLRGEYIHTMLDQLIKLIHLEKHKGSNSLAVHTSNTHGYSQGGTQEVTNAAFGNVGLYYSLSDASGEIIDTTSADVSGLNALYVHLNSRSEQDPLCSKSISSDNPLKVEFQGEYHDAELFDLTVSGPLTTFTDISNQTVNIHSLSLVNESPTTVWVRLYDISVGVAEAAAELSDLSSNVVLNLSIPHLETRDLTFTPPMIINNGLYFSSSTSHKRDNNNYPPGGDTIFINGTYKPRTN
jgi:hypothetical protein